MKTIELTQGFVTIVDNEDYAELNAYKWHANRHPTGVYYARRTAIHANGKRRKIQMHRQILNAQPGQPVDHANHNTLDNRRANIRLCTQSQNNANERKQRRTTSSRFKDVYWHKGDAKWHACISVDGARRQLGYFDDEMLAARAYNVAAVKHFGEFAWLNDV